MAVKVAKFGGSSLADAGQFTKVANIVAADPARRYIVPSAPGKRYENDTKVTDLLYAAYDARGTDQFDTEFSRIEKRYNTIIAHLGMKLDLSREYETIKQNIQSGASRDYVASRGEYLSAQVLAALLGFPFIDAANLIYFDENGQLDEYRTYEAFYETKVNYTHAVIPGFYGANPDGTIRTFSRGGSDITGAIVARGVDAAVYENWTDVSGFMVTNPKIVENPKSIGYITFRELRELAYMGASVLHEDAVFPVKSANIPINIRNTNDPSHPGTIISNIPAAENDSPITGIAGKRGFSIIHIEKDGMNNEVGFTRRALEILEKQGISFEFLPSGIDTMGIIISNDSLGVRGEALAKQIGSAVDADIAECISGLAIIAVVGRGMVRAKGVAARIFNAIARANINIRMIDQGSSELNIIVGVDEYDFRSAMNAIYEEFFPRG
ncbi:MAG: aspartate kinase [Oscillospiraceae bacterium]|nr:aspartate kinase [Oscillospiraceae bacterium]